ncbi:unnamed protein product [Calypogeia fissa]
MCWFFQPVSISIDRVGEAILHLEAGGTLGPKSGRSHSFVVSSVQIREFAAARQHSIVFPGQKIPGGYHLLLPAKQRISLKSMWRGSHGNCSMLLSSWQSDWLTVYPINRSTSW